MNPYQGGIIMIKDIMKTVAIIGGTQTDTLIKLGKKRGLQVLHHTGETKRSRKKVLESIIRKADGVVIMEGAINHMSMNTARDLAEGMGKKIGYHTGFGASGALDKAVVLIG